jgi:sigma-B regulation protein RsbU (phosphoserine phosphatase)
MLKNSRILLVEDNAFQRQVLTHILHRSGFAYVRTAMHGREAVEVMRGELPDLVITDLEMPEMNGFDLCRLMKQDAQLQHVPVLVQTAMNDQESKSRIFKAGAVDFLPKPLNSDEFLARVSIHLERHTLLRELSQFKERIHGELEMAARTHRLLFPAAKLLEEISQSHGLRVQHTERRCTELGGDLWGIEVLDARHVAISITDFSGHGVYAALNTFRLHTLMQQLSAHACRPGDYLAVLNNQLEKHLPDDQFATIFYGVIDIQEQTLRYAAAGSPPPLLLYPDGRALFPDTSGIPLGAFRDSCYVERVLHFPRGSRLLLYSDALIETPDIHGHLMTQERMAELVPEGFDALLHFLQERYRSVWPDDLTIAFLRFVSAGNVEQIIEA